MRTVESAEPRLSKRFNTLFNIAMAMPSAIGRFSGEFDDSLLEPAANAAEIPLWWGLIRIRVSLAVESAVNINHPAGMAPALQ